MGFMPHSLEKGPIGNRLDYLARFPDVRDHVRERLTSWVGSGASSADVEHENHPRRVLQTISAYGHTIDVLGDKKDVFVGKLNYLSFHEPSLPERLKNGKIGRAYMDDDEALYKRNQDSTGNRVRFMTYWDDAGNAQPQIWTVIANTIVAALNSGRDKLEFWWDCSWDGEVPTAENALLSNMSRVMLRTPHSAVEGDDKRDEKEGPIDTEPDPAYQIAPP
jgi:hypothetical protein